MTNRNFDEWLNKFQPSISSYDYYIDLFTSIINGGCSDNEYKWLADRLENNNGKKI